MPFLNQKVFTTHAYIFKLIFKDAHLWVKYLLSWHLLPPFECANVLINFLLCSWNIGSNKHRLIPLTLGSNLVSSIFLGPFHWIWALKIECLHHFGPTKSTLTSVEKVYHGMPMLIIMPLLPLKYCYIWVRPHKRTPLIAITNHSCDRWVVPECPNCFLQRVIRLPALCTPCKLFKFNARYCLLEYK